MDKIIVLVVYLLFGSIAFAQNADIPTENHISSLEIKEYHSRKGQFLASWGWNRGWYTKSDITFSGDGFNFTLYDVKADDKQNPFGIKYFSPGDVTLPQTNYRLGYFISDNYTVSLGVDHMKYVMREDQDVRIDGSITTGDYNYYDNTYNHDGNYEGDTINLATNFIKFEHTDGLNYLFIGGNRFDNLNKLLGIRTDKFEVNLEEGIDLGVYMPRTNTTILGKERYDEFHVSGFGFSAKAGVNLTFFKHFYLQADFKYGYVNMPDIRITSNKADVAKQHFGFFELIYSFGYRFKIR